MQDLSEQLKRAESELEWVGSWKLVWSVQISILSPQSSHLTL